MRLAAVLIGAILANSAVDAHARQGVPSQAVLAEMGLSGMQVLSDDEALAIRGSGFSGGVGTAYHYRQSIYKLHKWVYDFHKRTKHFHKNVWRGYGGSKGHHSKHGKGHHSKHRKTTHHRPMTKW